MGQHERPFVAGVFFFCSSEGIRDRKRNREALNEIFVLQECPHTQTQPYPPGAKHASWAAGGAAVSAHDLKHECFLVFSLCVYAEALNTFGSVWVLNVCQCFLPQFMHMCFTGKQRGPRLSRTSWSCRFPRPTGRQGKNFTRIFHQIRKIIKGT